MSEEVTEKVAEETPATEEVVEVTEAAEEAPAVETAEATESAEETPAFNIADKKWYIVNTQTGSENTAKKAILERIKSLKMEEKFGEILVPQENVTKVVKGKRSTRAKKFFPGYIFIQMDMTEDAWHLVRNSSKVTGFVGGKGKPPEISVEEVSRITQQIETGAEAARTQANFTVGDEVNVTDGPFSNFNGTVEDVDDNKGKVKVLVSIFGRPTPVELDFAQVERL